MHNWQVTAGMMFPVNVIYFEVIVSNCRPPILVYGKYCFMDRATVRLVTLWVGSVSWWVGPRTDEPTSKSNSHVRGRHTAYAPWFCSFRLWRFINHLLTSSSLQRLIPRLSLPLCPHVVHPITPRPRVHSGWPNEFGYTITASATVE